MTLPTQKTSLWRAQLGALGLDVEAAATAEAQAEARRIAAFSLPALALPERASAAPRPRRLSPSLGYALLGLALAAVLTPGLRRILAPGEERLTPRGGVHVAVYWERQGVVRPMGEGGPLAANDRLRAEVSASVDSVAYWGVVDAGGRPMVEARFVAGSALAVAAERPAAFAQSLRLDTAPRGESLVVLVCDQRLADPAAALAAAEAPGGCVRTPFALR